MEILQQKYLSKFKSRDGSLYGLRLGNPGDAELFTKAYVAIFGYEYTDAKVYDVGKLAEDIARKNTFYFVGECLDHEEPEFCGGGVIDIDNPATASMNKLLILPKFRGKGLLSEMGIKGVLNIFKKPQFKTVIRVNVETRASLKNTQISMRNQGSKPYGFNPIFVNLGDRQYLNKKEEKPYLRGKTVPIIFYLRTLNNFWERRNKVIYLLNNENILYFYDYQVKNNRKMKKNDLLITMEDSDYRTHDIEIKQNFNFGAIHMKGYMHDIFIKMYLKKFKKWRFIDWRIPATEEGVRSMKLAFNNGFKVNGYDMGSYLSRDGNLHDSVLFTYFPKKVKLNPNEPLDILKKVRPIVDKVLDSL
ncbi:MAG: hypothetical protein ACTSP9_13530 [Promethearchaeota archaeon]